MFVAVLRNVAHAQNAAAADGRVGDVHAAHGDRAAGRGFQTGYGIYQLALAVAVDARDADDLARVYLKADVFDCVVLMDFGGNGEVLHIQNHLRRVRLALGDCEFHVTADHHPGQLCLGGIRDVHGAHVLALAQNGAAVGNRHDLVKLVGDKEDRFPFRREIAHNLQQLLNLLRGQHGGRLVENQDLVVPVQHFQNFRALLHTDGDVLDQRVRIDPQAVFLRQRHDLFPGAGALKNAVLRILVTEDDVVQHGEALHQLEVLVNHADAQSIGIVGVVDFDLHAVLFDYALLSLIKAEQNAHQRGFTGAVFTQQGVYLALFQLERNIVVCDDTGEALRNVYHFDCVRYILQSNYLLFVPGGAAAQFAPFLPPPSGNPSWEGCRCRTVLNSCVTFYYTRPIVRFQIKSVEIGKFFGKKRERAVCPFSCRFNGDYFRLPSQETLTLVTAGSTEVSLETVMVPSNIPFTRAA